MLRKILTISIFLFFLTRFVAAQQFNGGVLAGLSTSQINGDTQRGFDKLGFYSGMYVSRDLSNALAFKIELLYIGKGAKKIVDKVEEFKTHLNYVEMPFLLTIKPVDKFHFNLGVAASYLINSKLFEQSYEVSAYTYDINKFDIGGIITGEYYFSEKLAFNLRFEYSIIPIRTKPRAWFNSNLSFGLLYVIRGSK